MFFGDEHTGNSQLVEGAHHLVAYRIVPLRTFADVVERADISKTPRNGVAQHLLVLRKSEIHQSAPCFCRAKPAVSCPASEIFAGFGSRGISRPRSAMMFFCI